jgi:hypothetical protein
MTNHAQFILYCDSCRLICNSRIKNLSKNLPEVPKIGNNWDILLRKISAQTKSQNIMKTFAVVFIPKHRLNEDDSSDFKQWKHVEGKDKESVINQVSEHGIVIECREVPE